MIDVNEEKIVKWSFWIVTIFVICVLFCSVNEFNSEMDKYQALYKGITTFDVVEKENSEKALELANWDKYLYNDNEIYVSAKCEIFISAVYCDRIGSIRLYFYAVCT